VHVQTSVVLDRQAEPVTQDSHELEVELADQSADGLLVGVDELAASFRVKRCQRSVPQRPYAAAEPVACLDDLHVRAAPQQIACSDQARKARTNDQHANATKLLVTRGQ
jgi:hypothetical protein